MPDPGYLLAVLATVFVITFALRALPFAVLRPLRQSRFVVTMATWLPAGILAILAAATWQSTVAADGQTVAALIAVVVTAAVHLTCGRRTLLSVGLGTLTYIGLLSVL
ncbi:AzlD domain-containing protein [Gordonia caeni]|uniref:Branched-chain amino acid exporter BrnE n=1 Tax=Gordonia caeni TaxID=1007097 RepID=A0ABP7NPR7_9ACTN